ncbi:hypothetical protein FHT21_001483 [Pedobacter sp. SG908]|nr:hypothetical protein [Pedobacter sp. SG908]
MNFVLEVLLNKKRENTAQNSKILQLSNRIYAATFLLLNISKRFGVQISC